MVGVDVTLDGILDLVTANAGAATVSILAGDGAGRFQPRADISAGNTPSGLVSADFNEDGLPDLAVANGTGGTVTILRNHCTP